MFTKYILISILVSYLVILVAPLEYKINQNIINSTKSEESKVQYITTYEDIRKILFEEKKNAIIVFYADWCPHCKDFLPIFDEASKYNVVLGFNFLQVNCGSKDICDRFKVNKYPTIQLYVEGENNEEEPNRDLESILEYLQKLTTNPIIELNDQEDLKNFRSNYGDVNFVVVLEKDVNNKYKETEFYNCIDKLANGPFKSMFYFGLIDKRNYSYEQFEENKYKDKLSYPDIVSIEDSIDDRFFLWSDNSCRNLEDYLRKNKFPYLIKINSAYIKRLQNESRILFLFALKDLNSNPTEVSSKKDNLSFREFESTIKPISKQYREFIFSYFDVDQDSYLTNFFKLNKSKLPCLILYDFTNRRYSIDYSNYNSVENLKESLLYIQQSFETNSIQWAHGNWLQDFLAKIGINLTERGSLILLGCVFILILVVLIFVMFCFGESNDEEFENEKKKFMEQLAATKELHEEEKKLILESKNFDSLVRMGLDKIIENLKGSVEEENVEDKNETDIIKVTEEHDKNKPFVDNLNSINDLVEEGDSSKQTLEMKKNN